MENEEINQKALAIINKDKEDKSIILTVDEKTIINLLKEEHINLNRTTKGMWRASKTIPDFNVSMVNPYSESEEEDLCEAVVKCFLLSKKQKI